MIQVCQTIAFAHEIGVIHRDLKPANIIIGKFGEVYVLDWGLAKVSEQVQSSIKIFNLIQKKKTTTYTRRQTLRVLRCICLQKLQGEMKTSMDDLMFALGIILFEMLTLQSFAQGKDIIEIKKMLLNEPCPLPRERVPKKLIPRDLEAVCLKALKRDRNKRYQKVSDFLADLQRYRHGKKSRFTVVLEVGRNLSDGIIKKHIGYS